LVINDGGANYDFRVEGDTDANLLVADASADAVGVGTASPAGKLNSVSTAASLTYPLTLSNLTDATTDVGAGIDFRLTTGNNTRGYIACRWTSGSGSNGTYLSFAPNDGSTGNVERARITSAGDLLVGTTTTDASCRFSVQGAVGGRWGFGPSNTGSDLFRVQNSNTTGVYLTNGGTSWTANSDERLKTDLQPILDAANKVSTLRAVTGRYKTDLEGTSRSFLIAQDVQEVFPEAVNTQDDEFRTLGLQYTDMVPLLTAAIQELSAKNDALEARIAALEAVPGNE
jgi:hypothetical protein